MFLVLEASGFGKLPEAAENPMFMVWNLEEVAVGPFVYFYKEIFIVLEASCGCSESVIDV